MKMLGCIAALGASLMMAHSAFARTSVAKVCEADVQTQCAYAKSGGGSLRDCVKAHLSDLSAACQTAMAQATAAGRACQTDVKQFCADVKPSRGAIASCLQSHTADLSGGCKAAMATAAAGAR
jgi:hypothetical protein